LKEKIKVPVFCTLQDEDVWVDAVHPPFREKIWHLMHQRSEDVDMMVSVSDYFAEKMKLQIQLPAKKVQTIHLGVDVDDYQYIPPRQKERNIGFISRMCYENGFDIVVDAFINLKKSDAFKDVKLIATGGSTGDDSKYIKKQIHKLKEQGLEHYLTILPEFEDKALHNFFSQVSLISVPVRSGEAFGIYLLESMASGVPVVQPSLGAFPEIIEVSGGGMTYKSNTPEMLAESWARLLINSDELEQLSQAGYQGTILNFNIKKQAGKIIDLYEKFIQKPALTL